MKVSNVKHVRPRSNWFLPLVPWHLFRWHVDIATPILSSCAPSQRDTTSLALFIFLVFRIWCSCQSINVLLFNYFLMFCVSWHMFLKNAAYLVPPSSNGHSTIIHGFSAASAGAIATMVTHPFDVIKVSNYFFALLPFGGPHVLLLIDCPIWRVICHPVSYFSSTDQDSGPVGGPIS